MAELRYPRTAAQRAGDFANARAFEEEVGTWLGSFKVGNLSAHDRMDWWVPGVFIDVKEKGSPLSAVWPIPPGCRHEDAFIIDELSIRRAMEKYPHAYFVMRDRPTGRVFLARVDEVVCGDHRRIDRVGSTDKAKGKWVVNLAQFRQLVDPANELMANVLGDQMAIAWRQSPCLIPEGSLP